MDTDKKEELVRRQKARERSSNLWKKSQIIWLIVSFSIIKLVHQFSLLCGTRRRRIGRPVHSRRQELRGKSRKPFEFQPNRLPDIEPNYSASISADGLDSEIRWNSRKTTKFYRPIIS
uniref:Uncharacterized protein n=1 Tax=Haemonchus contortus TaxID=6289 RepID=A0A7I4YJU6_HAECO